MAAWSVKTRQGVIWLPDAHIHLQYVGAVLKILAVSIYTAGHYHNLVAKVRNREKFGLPPSTKRTVLQRRDLRIFALNCRYFVDHLFIIGKANDRVIADLNNII